MEADKVDKRLRRAKLVGRAEDDPLHSTEPGSSTAFVGEKAESVSDAQWHFRCLLCAPHCIRPSSAKGS